MSYAELHCSSNFTFLEGASHPHELVERAAELGYSGLALTDDCSVAGVVRAHEAAKELRFKFIVGSEFTLVDGLRFVLLATNRAAYARLCRLITRARRGADKGSYRLERQQIAPDDLGDCLALWLPGGDLQPAYGEWLQAHCPQRTWLAVELLRTGDDRGRLTALTKLGTALGLPLVASGGVQMHIRERRTLQDLLTAIRLNKPITEVGYELRPSGERHLRSQAELAGLYPRALLEETEPIAERCEFSLDELRYEYPEELVPLNASAAGWLRKLTEEGARRRWSQGVPQHVRKLIEHELALIAELRYEAYFLTVHDLVQFATNRGILCQGRGSAANSTVCYCLGVTSVDPGRQDVLFERFISRERNEPPDIDIDFEHERREEVIQYVYGKYGRHRAAIVATLITYQPRSALRDAGKAMGLDPLQVDRLAHAMHWWDGSKVADERVRAAGFDPRNPLLTRLLERVHDFDPGPGVDTFQAITLTTGAIEVLSFQWDQPFASVSGAPGATSNVDIIFYDLDGNLVPFCDDNLQPAVCQLPGIDINPGADPVELALISNQSGGDAQATISLELVSGGPPAVMKYVYFDFGDGLMTDDITYKGGCNRSILRKAGEENSFDIAIKASVHGQPAFRSNGRPAVSCSSTSARKTIMGRN